MYFDQDVEKTLWVYFHPDKYFLRVGRGGVGGGGGIIIWKQEHIVLKDCKLLVIGFVSLLFLFHAPRISYL